MGAVKILSVVVGVLALGAAAAETCSSLPARTGVGRDTGLPFDSKADWCPSQIKVCGYICGGKTAANTCELSGSVACYECKCSSGSTPDLAQYTGTIPQNSCSLKVSNCWSAPGGGVVNNCPSSDTCGSIYLTANAGAASATTTKAAPSSSSTEPASTTSEAASSSTTTKSVAPSTSSSSSVTTTTTSKASSSSSTTLTPSTTSKSSTSSTTAASSSSTVTTSATPTEVAVSITALRVSTTTRPPAVTGNTLPANAARPMMTAAPWIQAAVGVAGLVMVGM